ncbi:hypothetical protein SAMN05444008_102375 [Cnuella takakiae]|uniref:Uncharacterized protein n=1 Tax=Cnuella takakiae TaxID=1302690 RepID=A0A1M4VT53_9BACT|nr:hypothetical protein [Cnuella takakiae]OLY92505.1 hypothetical protein BUE76_11855 [Cnuella takakiae]SHE72206.1 hypothetical protein SAMN05444008_102375 [Cnuella takakiae]
MVSQYPDLISFTPSATATRDGQGNWVEGVAGEAVQSSCRCEPASGNAQIMGVDGALISYASAVYLPQRCPELPQGASVTVTIQRDGQDPEIFTGTVKRFSRGQLNARAWL